MKPTFVWVEDLKDTLITFLEDLNDEGWGVEHFASVGLARERLSQVDGKGHIHLVVLDLLMDYGNVYSDEQTQFGRLTGLCLAQEIRARKLKVKEDIPILFLTNTLQIEPAVNAWIQANAPCKYLVKVPTMGEFESAIKDMLPAFPWG